MLTFRDGSPQTRPRVIVHIGLPKTGTTHLQDRMWRNRDAALRQGVLYPGAYRDTHFHAAVHLQPERYLDWVDPRHNGVWDRLVKEVRGWPGTALVSHELFSSAHSAHAAQVLDSLSFAEVHVLVTARDLARQIPSVWQENIKNQHTTEFGEFLGTIRTRDQPHDPFWEFQDLPRILDTWTRGVPPERVHVVTVPPPGSGPDLLWRRFTGVLGLDTDRLPFTVPGDNSSLSNDQVELLRRLNLRLQPDRIAWSRYESMVKAFLIGRVMFGAEASGDTPTLPDTELSWVREAAREAVEHIRTAGYRVVGDLTELEPDVGRGDGIHRQDTADITELALDTLADVVLTMPEMITDRSLPDRVKNLLRRQQRRLLSTLR